MPILWYETKLHVACMYAYNIHMNWCTRLYIIVTTFVLLFGLCPHGDCGLGSITFVIFENSAFQCYLCGFNFNFLHIWRVPKIKFIRKIQQLQQKGMIIKSHCEINKNRIISNFIILFVFVVMLNCESE